MAMCLSEQDRRMKRYSDNTLYKQLIHSPEWLRLRKRKYSANIWCEDCLKEGRHTPTEEIHHIVPCNNEKDPIRLKALMYDYNNLAALCHDCHLKRHMEIGRNNAELRKQRQQKESDYFKERFFL